MRIARGFLRLWMVFSVIWVVAVGALTWATLPTENPFDRFDDPAMVRASQQGRFEMIRDGGLWAAIPPTGLLLVGLMFGWVARGFRP